MTANSLEKDIAELKQLLKQFAKVEKEYGPVTTALQKLRAREAETPNAEAAAASAGKIRQRVKDVKAKTEPLVTQYKDTLKRIHKDSQALQDHDTAKLHRDIVEYLAFRGYDDLARGVADHYSIPLTTLPPSLQKQLELSANPLGRGGLDAEFSLRNMSDALLSNHDVKPAVEWSRRNREILQKFNNCLLEVVLRTQQLLQLCEIEAQRQAQNQGSSTELLSFVAVNLLPFAVSHPKRVQDAANCAARPPSENYRGMYDEAHWEFAATQLRRDFAHAMQVTRRNERLAALMPSSASLSPEQPRGSKPAGAVEGNKKRQLPMPALARHCVMGASVMRDLLPEDPHSNASPARPSGGSGSSADGSPNRHASSVNFACMDQKGPVDYLGAMVEALGAEEDRLTFRRSTQLYCVVTGKAMTNPRVLANGTVVSEEGYKMLVTQAAQSQGESNSPPTSISCPVTGETVSLRNVKKLFIV